MTRSKKVIVVVALSTLATLLAVVSVLALVPPGAFGYVTVCHRAGLPTQQTLILRPSQAATHIRHGDPQVRCAEPLPQNAAGVPIDPAKGYHVAEISNGLYWLTEGAYTMMFLVTGEGVIVVDAPPSIGGNILNAIAEVTDEPITHVIYSHSHADHISAAGIYPPGATYIAHEETAAQLARINDPNRPFPYGIFVGGGPVPLPTVTFSDTFQLNVGTQTLELAYRGINHEPGNIFVYAPDQKVLNVVDIIFPGWTPFQELALAEDIPGYFQAHDEILSYDFDALVAGHLGRLGTRDDVETQKAYIQDLQANAAQALQTVDFFGIAQQTGFQNAWLLFDTYLDAVAQRCAELTLADWQGVLGGADVNTFGHCLVVTESLRID